LNASPKELNNFQKRARRKHNVSKSCTNISSSNEQDCYTLDMLIKKWTENQDYLDDTFKNEFLGIKNLPANKTFDDSLKLQNANKSRYKNIFPCKIFFLIKYQNFA